MEKSNILQEYFSLCEAVSSWLRDQLIDLQALKYNKAKGDKSMYLKYSFRKFSRECILLKSTPYTRYKEPFKIRPTGLITLDLLTKSYPKWGKALERFLEDMHLVLDDKSLLPHDLLTDNIEVPFLDLLLLAMGIDPVKSFSLNAWTLYPQSQRGMRIQSLYIKAYRQLTLYLYKLELPYDEVLLLQKQYGFVKNDTHKASQYPSLTKPYKAEIKEFIAGFLEPLTTEDFVYSIVIDEGKIKVDAVPLNFDVSRAKHSQGAVSNLISRTRAVTRRAYTPPSRVHHISNLFDYIAYRGEGRVIPAKVQFVPKDSRGPRMIAMEPDYLGVPQSYIQEMLYDRLEDYGIDLHNQDNNRFAALKASSTRDFATIDLKNASDNILTDHILDLFPSYWSELLLSLRSSQLILTDGHIHDAHCFATMGNKLTFPIQTIVFLAIACVATRLVRSRKDVLVYGDDIIVPTKAFNKTVQLLQEWGFDINLSKSFTKGFFRESCGIFAYAGHNVNCVYRRKVELTAEHINELLSYGYPVQIPDTFSCLQNVEGAVNLRMSGDRLRDLNIRWNNHLQRVEVKQYVSRATRLWDNSAEKDRFYLDEWLRLYSSDSNPIHTPRTIARYTEHDESRSVFVELPIANLPSVICYRTLIQAICKEYCYDNDLPWLDLSANEIFVAGDIQMLDSEFIPADISINKYEGDLTMKNFNYEFIKGLSVLNKKVDTIIASFKVKAATEKASANSKAKNSKARAKGKNNSKKAVNNSDRKETNDNGNV